MFIFPQEAVYFTPREEKFYFQCWEIKFKDVVQTFKFELFGQVLTDTINISFRKSYICLAANFVQFDPDVFQKFLNSFSYMIPICSFIISLNLVYSFFKQVVFQSQIGNLFILVKTEWESVLHIEN